MVDKKINWTLNVSIPGGPSITASSPLVIEAYDMIDVEIPYSEGEKKIQICPGISKQIKFLMIKADPYIGTDGTTLKYKVSDGGTKKSPDIELTAPVHLFLGSGNVNILGIPPNYLLFTNKLKKDGVEIPVSVQILIGRDATPEDGE